MLSDLSDLDLRNLVAVPKAIVKKIPTNGYVNESGHRRCDLELESSQGPETDVFAVFVRQNLRFIENYSLGLRYRSGDPVFGTITLVRYSGPHGEVNRDRDGHYATTHIHRLTAQELRRGSRQPAERHRELTDRYSTFESALRTFFADTGVSNFRSFFPELSQLDMFDDC